MAWKIEPEEKKSIVVKDKFEKTLKNGTELYFVREIGYRWGYVIVEDDPRDIFEQAQLNDEPLCVDQFNVLDHAYDDGCWSDMIGVDTLPKREQKKLEEFHYDEGEWECVDSETYFHGDLTITEVTDEYPYDEIE
jgi:hypothetical protein